MRGSTVGLAEGMIAPPKNAHALFLAVVDVLFSTIILAPTIVTYWRGTWNLMDYVLFADEHYSAFASLTIGIVGHMFFTLCQDQFAKSFHPDKHRITYLLFSRLYTYIYGIVCVNGWRGGWMLLDNYIPLTIKVIFTITFISVMVLSVLKGLRNISAAPFAVATDNSKEYFQVPTMYKTVRLRTFFFYAQKQIFETCQDAEDESWSMKYSWRDLLVVISVNI